mgnify:CR=1 FL=1|tara:strand:- start:2667 stop:3320 length:654 start_codon:yes stop_codon:yes gene_type:complete
MKELEIYFPIGQSFWEETTSAAQVKTFLDESGGEDIVVRVNSPGGDVFEGFAIFNLFKQYSGKVLMEIDGMAASAASVVAMAGDTINMGIGSMLMIHDPWTVVLGNSNDMKATADLLDSIRDGIIDTYLSKNTKQDVISLSTMMSDETWFSAKEAVAAGFADTTSLKDEAGVEASSTLAFNVSYPWINNAPKPEDVPEETQAAWRIAHNKRRLAMIE